jgi:hypothetical protein
MAHHVAAVFDEGILQAEIRQAIQHQYQVHRPIREHRPVWLNRSETQRHYTEQHQLKRPGKKEQKGIIKRLIAEGLRATVPDDDFKSRSTAKSANW